jgi:hypothetical protein
MPHLATCTASREGADIRVCEALPRGARTRLRCPDPSRNRSRNESLAPSAGGTQRGSQTFAGLSGNALFYGVFATFRDGRWESLPLRHRFSVTKKSFKIRRFSSRRVLTVEHRVEHSPPSRLPHLSALFDRKVAVISIPVRSAIAFIRVTRIRVAGACALFLRRAGLICAS